jgi:hypothetical protein
MTTSKIWTLSNPAKKDGQQKKEALIYNGGTTSLTLIISYDNGLIKGFSNLVPIVNISYVQDGILKSQPIDLYQELSITGSLIEVLTWHGQAEASGSWQIVST